MKKEKKQGREGERERETERERKEGKKEGKKKKERNFTDNTFLTSEFLCEQYKKLLL
jgi:hypothetical protein